MGKVIQIPKRGGRGGKKDEGEKRIAQILREAITREMTRELKLDIGYKGAEVAGEIKKLKALFHSYEFNAADKGKNTDWRSLFFVAKDLVDEAERKLRKFEKTVKEIQASPVTKDEGG